MGVSWFTLGRGTLKSPGPLSSHLPLEFYLIDNLGSIFKPHIAYASVFLLVSPKPSTLSPWVFLTESSGPGWPVSSSFQPLILCLCERSNVFSSSLKLVFVFPNYCLDYLLGGFILGSQIDPWGPGPWPQPAPWHPVLWMLVMDSIFVSLYADTLSSSVAIWRWGLWGHN